MPSEPRKSKALLWQYQGANQDKVTRAVAVTERRHKGSRPRPVVWSVVVGQYRDGLATALVPVPRTPSDPDLEFFCQFLLLNKHDRVIDRSPETKLPPD